MSRAAIELLDSRRESISAERAEQLGCDKEADAGTRDAKVQVFLGLKRRERHEVWLAETVRELTYDFNALYDESKRTLYAWDGYRWTPAEGRVRTRVREMMASVESGVMMNDAEVSNVYSAFRDTVRAPEVDWNACETVIPFRNGYWDSEHGVLTAPKPELLFTYYIDADYREDAGCPRFEKFLQRVLPSEEDRQTLQRYAGYCLMPSVCYQKSLFLVGKPATGKSTFLDILEQTIGAEHSARVSVHDLQQQFGTGPLFGKLLAICGDIPSGALSRVDIFRQIVTDSTIHYNVKFKPQFTARNISHLIQTANQLPRLPSETSDARAATYRRMIVLEFDVEIPPAERVPNLAARIVAEERAGIIQWALEGLSQLHSSGGNFGYDESKVREQYANRTDAIATFLLECVVPDETGFVSNKELRDAYNDWALANGENSVRDSQASHFSRRVRECGFEPVKRGGARGFKINAAEPEPEPTEEGEI